MKNDRVGIGRGQWGHESNPRKKKYKRKTEKIWVGEDMSSADSLYGVRRGRLRAGEYVRKKDANILGFLPKATPEQGEKNNEKWSRGEPMT